MEKIEDLKTGTICITGDGECRLVLGRTLIGRGIAGGIAFDQVNKTPNNEVIKIYSEPKCEGGLCAGLKYWFDDREDAPILEYCNLIWEKKP